MCWLVLLCSVLNAQPVELRLRNAAMALQNDPQLRHGQVSFVVLDAMTGKQVYALNQEMGLAPASTQKIFTAIAAFDLLGNEFQYVTNFSLLKVDSGNALIISASGDPTFGSDRWIQTNEATVLANLRNGLAANYIGEEDIRFLSFINPGYSSALVPDGWIWQDIGNYYGAGVHAFNWRENQFDVLFKTGNSIGDPVTVSGFKPAYLKKFHFDNSELLTAAKGSGDNGYIFFDPWKANAFRVTGTLPAGEKAFSLSAAYPEPREYFLDMLRNNRFSQLLAGGALKPSGAQLIYSHKSPSLDSITYWFLQKSINLYGEALLHSIALKKTGTASTEKGIDAMMEYWTARGIDSGSLHILDGSGLSPQNRVSARALATALLYAGKQQWFSSFYKALPLINGQHMKSGSIEGARAYAGYQRAANGRDYIFAIIVNNYQGAPSSITKKLWTLLDTLK